MRLYFACSITGGREDEPVYQAIVNYLVGQGHEVPTAYLAQPNVMELEAVADAGDVYRRDIAWIDSCEALIAEVTTPSHGVGYEIGYALSVGKPVLSCYRESTPVSKMILGNPHPLLRTGEYASPEEAVALVAEFLRHLEDSRLMGSA